MYSKIAQQLKFICKNLIFSVFLDDSFADRIWVDHPDCQPFVKNILTAFATKIPKKDENNEEEMKEIFEEEIILPRYLLGFA